MRNKFVSAAEAVALVQNGDTIATSGFVGIGVPDELLAALQARHGAEAAPRDLTLLFAAGQGDGKERGLNRLAADGLLRRVVGGHWGLIPKIGRLALEERIEGYNLPQGVISQMFRDIAAGKPGTITRVGLRTFVDPRLEGGRINDITREDLVRLIEIGGEEFLFYQALRINVALLRATTADPDGNLTMEREALTLDNLAMATAARNCGGIVIAQVERAAAAGSLHPRQVVVPGVLVDCVVLADPANHAQTYRTQYSPAFSAELRVPLEGMAPLVLDERKVIARRAAMELPVNGVVNLGIGMPEGVAAIANEERILDLITLTAEPGVIGGMPASGLDFGAAVNTHAVIQQNQQFDFYDGGGLDLACLGLAEVGAVGDVNVSRFGARLAGAGGFINISQNARRVVFMGTFTAGSLDARIEDGELRILQEGRSSKFRQTVQQVTFSGPYAAERGREVLYITERCVFRLTTEGLELAEVAPGIDVERDILAHMGFRPIIRAPRPMDARIFGRGAMDLRTSLLDLHLSERIAYDSERNLLFLNFERMHVRDRKDVEAIRAAVQERCREIGKRVAVVVNYDGFRLEDEAADTYAAMVREVADAHYTEVSRYTTSAFLRHKLSRVLTRLVAPHIFETQAEARAFHEKTAGGGGNARGQRST